MGKPSCVVLGCSVLCKRHILNRGTLDSFGASRLGTPEAWADDRAKFVDFGTVQPQPLDHL